MSARPPSDPSPRSLLWATDIDVLPADRVVERREGYRVIRSPSNPTHYWGNLLLFDDPPAAGDGVRWLRLFADELGGDPRVQHQTFGWDVIDGALGNARAEFVPRGFELEQTVGLTAAPAALRAHPRENGDVQVRALDPAAGADEQLWEAVVKLQVTGRDASLTEASSEAFSRRRLQDLRVLFRAGRGAWYVALTAGDRKLVGSCGVVVTAARGRFQSVATAAAYRRQGICSRLVVQAARLSAERYGARCLVIGADLNYHALGLYESLGFQRRERVCGVYRPPSSDRCTEPDQPAATAGPDPSTFCAVRAC